MADNFHALVLTLHQPPGNLDDLLAQNNWEAKEILYAYDRIARTLWSHEDLGRAHLAISGTLLETLAQPEFQQRVYGVVDCGALLWHWQNSRIFEILGTGYYHPVLPLIAPADWDEHLLRWLESGRHFFNKTHFPGFWPPEMGFCMELIPHLKRLGYDYVLVDSEHVEPIERMSWQELRYRPHIARFGDAEIIVVVRDRELSNAQASGMEADWFLNEIAARTRQCDFPALITTCSSGENGGWFRNLADGSNFWSGFYRDYMTRIRDDEDAAIRPIFISDYLRHYGAQGEVNVRTGAWNTGWYDGGGFDQWLGSQAQRDALTRVAEISQAVHGARQNALAPGARNPELYALLEQALWRVLRAETSCHFFWSERWVQRCHQELDAACMALSQADTAYRAPRH